MQRVWSTAGLIPAVQILKFAGTAACGGVFGNFRRGLASRHLGEAMPVPPAENIMSATWDYDNDNQFCVKVLYNKMGLFWRRKHAENTTDCNVKTVFCYKQIYIYKKQDKRHRKHAMVTNWSLEINFLYCAQRKTRSISWKGHSK